MWIGRKLCATQGDLMKLEADAGTAANSQGIQCEGCQLWADSHHYGLHTWEKLILSKILSYMSGLVFRTPSSGPSLHSFKKQYKTKQNKHISFLSACQLISVIILLPTWTFSALHFLGLCKKTNIPAATSPSYT